ncbi:MAG: sensor histidine kinase, partial [Candidatus Methylomirabilales bacterium]
VLAIEAGKLEQTLESSGRGVPEKLRHMKEQMMRLATDVHAISRQLHPSILDDLGLVDAMDAECTSFSQREGILVTYEPENVPETLPKELGLCLYRITQEALRNISKHAQAREARVSLFGKDGVIILRIEDFGVGFDAAQMAGKRGLGLASMEERARLVRAELRVDSRPGRGTVIEVRAPLRGRT